jgi:ferredoxin
MKAKIDEKLCSGHGRCNALAPEVYELDDDGYNGLRGRIFDVGPEDEDAARLGAESCPELAITLAED